MSIFLIIDSCVARTDYHLRQATGLYGVNNIDSLLQRYSKVSTLFIVPKIYGYILI